MGVRGLSLRYKLLAMVLAPILIGLPLLLALTIFWGHDYAMQQLLLKVNTDLSVARDAFRRSQHDYLAELNRLSGSFAFREALLQKDYQALDRLVRRLVAREGFAFARLLRPESLKDELLPASPLHQLALSGEPASGVEIFGPEQLKRIAPALAAKVRLPLRSTPRAVPTQRNEEDRAMVLRSVYPVRDAAGQVVALIDGGVFLNGNFDFVDAIRELVYGPGSLLPGSIGTVTVFLDDVRISTNVELRDGVRALGTRVSKEVRDRVLGQGKPWSDRAFVVNDWYISAYEPIVDVHGQRVGMLYAGFLDRPFRDAYNRALWLLVTGFLAIVGFSTLLAVFGARRIFRPVERMIEVVRATQAGESRRMGDVRARDELGELAHQFDRMLDLLEQHTKEIERAAETLELQVDERTRELQEKNRDLEQSIQALRQTREQLVVSEKFAALGRLSAGFAHEINNPVTILLGNLELLVQDLGEQARPVAGEIELMFDQIERINALVNNLLHYARPTEFVGQIDNLDVREILQRTRTLAEHLARRSGITVELRHGASRKVRINPNELQQVLMNLVINGIQAMPDGGTLILASDDWEEKGVVLSVSDQGSGIEPEHLQHIFDPFFSTKGQQKNPTSQGGTGLGLFISYGLIKRYGGDLDVSSQPGQGSTFRVFLLCEPEMDEEGDAWLGGFRQGEYGEMTRD